MCKHTGRVDSRSVQDRTCHGTLRGSEVTLLCNTES